ncbi:MAG: hypothetical protein AMXMBFR84_17190 [Candidatus Hydrogenedentota bacterium]
MKRLRWTVNAALAGAAAFGFGYALPVIAQDEAEVKIELPAPVFGGTPLDYFSDNLEERSYKPREPFKAPAGTELLSKGKPVTCSTQTNFGKLEQITDGDKEAYDSSLVEVKKGAQWVQIDLGKTAEVHGVVVWHYHAAERVYFDTIVKVSDDPNFEKDATTIYNNDHDNSAGLGVGEDKEYIETYEGRLIKGKAAKGRYVRLYTNGNTTDDANHYLEVEVFGKPL